MVTLASMQVYMSVHVRKVRKRCHKSDLSGIDDIMVDLYLGVAQRPSSNADLGSVMVLVAPSRPGMYEVWNFHFLTSARLKGANG